MKDPKSPVIPAEYHWLISYTESELHKSQLCAGVNKYCLDQCDCDAKQCFCYYPTLTAETKEDKMKNLSELPRLFTTLDKR